jgi:hypothetical protein
LPIGAFVFAPSKRLLFDQAFAIVADCMSVALLVDDKACDAALLLEQ